MLLNKVYSTVKLHVQGTDFDINVVMCYNVDNLSEGIRGGAGEQICTASGNN